MPCPRPLLALLALMMMTGPAVAALVDPLPFPQETSSGAPGWMGAPSATRAVVVTVERPVVDLHRASLPTGDEVRDARVPLVTYAQDAFLYVYDHGDGKATAALELPDGYYVCGPGNVGWWPKPGAARVPVAPGVGYGCTIGLKEDGRVYYDWRQWGPSNGHPNASANYETHYVHIAGGVI